MGGVGTQFSFVVAMGWSWESCHDVDAGVMTPAVPISAQLEWKSRTVDGCVDPLGGPRGGACGGGQGYFPRSASPGASLDRPP